MRNIVTFTMVVIGFIISHSAVSQVQFTAEASRDNIGINERVKVSFTVNKPGDNFTPPDFEAFRKVGGPNQSVSQQFVNGKSYYELSFTYFLEPQKKGTLRIDQATINIEGKIYKTTPVSIKVGDAVDKPNDKSAIKKREALNGIHLVAEVSKSRPYLNEPIYVVYKLYVSRNTNVRNWQAVDNPDFENFWSRNIDNDQLSVKSGSFGGEPYRYVALRKTVLYPQKTGELKIKPLTLDLSVEVPTDRRDIFGRRLYETVEHRISAKTRTVNVKPLPKNGKPASFTGAVGKFTLETSTDRADIEQGESTELELKISGRGNLQLINLPDVSSPPGLELYEPERKEDIKVNANGMRGSVTNTYTLVGQNAGKFPISPIEFSYFDLRSGSYKTLSSDEIVIDVKGRSNAIANNNDKTNEIDRRTPVNKISGVSSFKFIKTDTNLRPLGSKHFFRSATYWVLALTPIGLALGSLFFFIFRKNQPHGKDETSRKVQKLAKKYLSEAKQNLDKPDKFYQSLEMALYNFLKAKLDISTSDITKQSVAEKLTHAGVSVDNKDKFIEILSKCERARYASFKASQLGDDYNHAARVITSIDKEIKS